MVWVERRRHLAPWRGVTDLTLVSLDAPSEVRTFEKGRFELYRVGPMTLGRATLKVSQIPPSSTRRAMAAPSLPYTRTSMPG